MLNTITASRGAFLVENAVVKVEVVIEHIISVLEPIAVLISKLLFGTMATNYIFEIEEVEPKYVSVCKIPQTPTNEEL